MKIQKFKNEKELENWVESNIKKFFGADIIFIPGKHFIYTKRDKGAKPDGFLLDLNNSSWTIIEHELLKHGVWNHIAEQIMRFIVASKSIRTQKKIRDLFLDEIENKKLISRLSKQFDISESRLFQRIENIIEGQSPNIAIFIDDVNEDLEDMTEALSATVQVFRVQKFYIEGKIEIYSPDQNQPVLEKTVEEVETPQYLNNTEIIERLGGGNLSKKVGFINLFSLNDGGIVTTKYSKNYGKDGFWFGITPPTVKKYKNEALTHLIFILADSGFVKVPIDILEDYLKNAFVSKKVDGSIKHYHIYIKIDKEKVILYTSTNKNVFDVSNYFFIAD